MSLAAGRLRELISIRRLTDVPDGAGGFTREWGPLPGMSEVRAEIIGKSGRESVIANTLQGIATYQVVIRHRDGIEINDQILWKSGGDLELNILAPPSDPTGRREMLLIMADTSAPEETVDEPNEEE